MIVLKILNNFFCAIAFFPVLALTQKYKDFSFFLFQMLLYSSGISKTMIANQNKDYISLEEYLAGEELSQIKHEYISGQIYAIASASDAHVTIAGNLFALLRNHVRGSSCRVYMADMKAYIETANIFYYPDIMVTCDARSLASQVTIKNILV